MSMKKEIYWQQHVDAWQAGLLTQAAYCKKHKLARSSFGFWKKKLTQRTQHKSQSSNLARSSSQSKNNGLLVLNEHKTLAQNASPQGSPTPLIVPVPLTPQASAASMSPIKLHLKSYTLEIGIGFCPKTLQALLTVLESQSRRASC